MIELKYINAWQPEVLYLRIKLKANDCRPFSYVNYAVMLKKYVFRRKNVIIKKYGAYKN